jgi:ubiquinone/menaquinone biosynthesis C-methylase UbiE
MDLELGSGMGLHLCLLAAAYPEGSFVGADFHVDQITHSLKLQQQLGLTNLLFVQADFLPLADALAAELEPRSFDYVVAHGVLTWVTPPVQQALLGITARLLAIGGLFFCFYNTLPGWQAAEIYQHLAEQEHSCSHPADALGAYLCTVRKCRISTLFTTLATSNHEEVPGTHLYPFV